MLISLTLLIWTLGLHSAVTGQCTLGSPPCQITCHCQSHPCPINVQSGCGATEGCEPGWDGPICQRNNVVYGLKLPNVDTGSSRVEDKNYRSKAFDGKLGTRFTTRYTYNPYLWVNLQEMRLVHKIKLYTSVQNPQYISGFQVDVSNWTDFQRPKQCYKDPRTRYQEEYTINCRNVGHYLRILVPRTTKLTIRELQVYKCGDYFFGDECDRICNCRDPNEICNWITGQCSSGCPDGYTGTDCYQECPYGKFGENCQRICHCRNQNWCNHVNGKCDDGQGCADGFAGGTCQMCRIGRFGQDCKRECHCKIQLGCNTVTGICGSQGCAEGYSGPNCQGFARAGPDESECVFLSFTKYNTQSSISCSKFTLVCATEHDEDNFYIRQS